MSCLPSIKRVAGAEAPDGTPLSSEDDAVIAFLDECVQRCLKTPHRYIEELSVLGVGGDDENEESGQSQHEGQASDALPSPLLMTVREQFVAKISGGHFTPSDALAVATFVRKLVLVLGSKLEDLKCLEKFAERLVGSLEGQPLFESRSVVGGAIQREGEILKACLESYRNGPITPQVPKVSNSAVQQFLGQLEELAIREYLFYLGVATVIPCILIVVRNSSIIALSTSNLCLRACGLASAHRMSVDPQRSRSADFHH